MKSYLPVESEAASRRLPGNGRWILVFFLILIFTGQDWAGQDQAQTNTEIGRVFLLRGRWKRQGRTVTFLKQGDRVYANDVIAIDRLEITTSIGVALNNGQVIECGPSTTRCQRRISMPSQLASAEDSLPSRVIQAVRRVLEHGPPPVYYAISRGENSGPREAVLLYHDHELNLAPALHLAPGPKYEVELAKLDSSGQILRRERIQLAPEVTSLKVEPDLTPGVYSLRLFSLGPNQTNIREVGSTVAVLITPPENYQELAREFSEVVNASEAWKGKLDEVELHYVFTVYLYDLSARPVPPSHEDI